MRQVVVRCPHCGADNHAECAKDVAAFSCGTCGQRVLLVQTDVKLVVLPLPPALPQTPAPPARKGFNWTALVAGIGLLAVFLFLGIIRRQTAPEGESGPNQDTYYQTPEAASESSPPTREDESLEKSRTVVSLPNGKEIVPPHGGVGPGWLKVENNTGRDAVLKLAGLPSVYDGSRILYRFVYVRTGSSIRIRNIGAGTYDVFFCVGTDWDTSGQCFLRDRAYSAFQDHMRFDETRTPRGLNYSTWTVTLHPVVGGNARTESVSPEEFDAIK